MAQRAMVVLAGVVLFISLPGQLFSQSTENKTLVISGIDSNIEGTAAKQILTEAYQRLGITIVLKTFPAERALLISNSGVESDGELLRISGLGKDYPNLVVVPVAIVKTDVMAFVKKTEFKVSGWQSLAPYRIGIRLGVKFAENGTRGMNTQVVPTDEQNFMKLEENRVDVVVANRLTGFRILKEDQLRDIHPLEPPIEQVQFFHYLHKKNSSLVPKIKKILEEMEAEGRIQAIFDGVFASVAN
jgi:ABC-type amino acid transport substrate-binding protein